MTLNAETITSLATLVTAIGALIYAIRGNNNSRRNTSKIKEVQKTTSDVKTQLNANAEKTSTVPHETR